MVSIKSSRASFAFLSITWLRYASPISPDVADPSPSSCHEFPCQDSDGSHGTRNLNSNNLPGNIASPVLYEAYFRNEVNQWLNQRKTEIENTVFISYDSQGYPYQSTSYVYDDFVETLRSMSIDGAGGGDDQILFYIGQTDENILTGLVNVAAFLAHAMAVSIKYDVCDEVNMDATDFTKKYAVSNSCGQWGLSYQDEVCVGDEAFMTCDVDLDMAMTAADSLDGEKAPPPLECRPRERASDFTGHWDGELGFLSEAYPYANRVGVMHNEGCCWWGRGVLMTRGTCNFGKLNQYLGRLGAEQGFINFYDVDLCNYPEIVCQGDDTMGLRWSVGYFHWADSVQTFKNTTEGLDYMKDLNTFVDSGFLDVNRFIDVVGRALSSGCVEAICLEAEDKVKQERRDNFLNLVFNVFDLPYLVETTPFPTPPPTNRPTQDSNPSPLSRPTPRPTSRPTPRLTPQPMMPPTMRPIMRPTKQPTSMPSKSPTKPPTLPPTTARPTNFPTARPSKRITQLPTTKPSVPVPRQTQSPTSKATIGQTLPAQSTLPVTICDGRSSAFVPVEECREYVQCVDGEIVARQSCAAGLLFDSSINACNWESTVTSCTAPTKKPTPKPTQRTLKPTQQTPKPIQQPLDTTPKVPQPPLTPPPSIRPVPIPASTRPPFEDQSPIGQPSASDYDDAQEKEANTLTPSQKPSSQKPLDEDEDLISLPSGTSLGMKYNLVMSIGILWMAVVGALT